MERNAFTANNPGSAVVVGVASTPVLDKNFARINAILSNDSTSVIYLRLADSPAVLNSGIRLAPGEKVGLEGYMGAVTAISSAAAMRLTVVEY